MAVDDLNEAADNLRGSFGDLQDILDKLAENLTAAAKATNDLADNLQRVASEGGKAKKVTKDIKGDIDKAKKAQEKQNKATEAFNKLAAVGRGSLLAIVQAIQDADKEMVGLVRDLAISKEEAALMKSEFQKASFAARDIALNSTRLIEAQGVLNSQLGTAFKFSTQTLGTFSKLTKVVGLSAKAASNLAFQAQLQGKSFREVEENILGASRNLQRQKGIALNSKSILEGVGNVTGQIRANLGANPEAIAEAVTQAKLLGTELNALSAAGRTLLNFEQSIEKELEAELLIGKQLNLERARSAALAGDEITLGQELAKNIGTQAEFLKLNVLQREALAAAVGMEASAVADMLFNQETMGMNAEQLRAIGKDTLADRVEELSLQDKIAAAQERLQTSLQELALKAMPLIDGFASLVEYISNSEGAMKGLVQIMATLAGISILKAVATIYSSFGMLGIAGIGLAAMAVTEMMNMAQIAQNGVRNMAEGGIVMPRAGGTIARIGEAGQPEAVIPLNRARQMGFGGESNPQPIVIQNNWDAFAASNGNGRRGLGGTQALQASPTFA